MTPADFFGEIGGVPFLDTADLKPRTLLTAVASVRRNTAPQAHPRLADYLDPANAGVVFAAHAVSTPMDVPWQELPVEDQAAIDRSVARITDTSPDWQPLLAVPIRYRKMPTSTSSTSVLVPQTIYLGPPAFRTQNVLDETLVHEHAHVWLNFIAEVFDLQLPDAPHDYVLPSGTSGKTLRGVLFAAHFAAAAALLFQRRSTNDPAAQARMTYLDGYLAGCLNAVDERPCLSDMGKLVLLRLRDAHARLVQPLTPDLTPVPGGDRC
jgi:hypothetical protein